MRIEGTLSKWTEDRGFGFITPSTGGPEVFVHISTFPKDGTRPRIGERLSFEIELGEGGKKQAKRLVCLDRSVTKNTTERQRTSTKHRETPSGPGFLSRFLPLILVAGLAYYGYGKYLNQAESELEPLRISTPLKLSDPVAEPAQATFHCDGRTHCSQMSSCAEATFFLRHCPGVTMDGDNDGVPCEQQWCSSPFSR